MDVPIARGRSADVYAHGDGLVLRRYRDGGDARREAEVMVYARSQGFPCPAVEAADGPDLVMERVSGPTMLADLSRRPWTIRRHARTLAALHERLHTIRAPDSLRAPFGGGSALLHMDLHPENVLLSPSGPVVIDLSNAVRGPAECDVAYSWILMVSAEIPEHTRGRRIASLGRRSFVGTFLIGVDRAAAARRLPTMLAHWEAERNSTPSERETARRLIDREIGVSG